MKKICENEHVKNVYIPSKFLQKWKASHAASRNTAIEGKTTF